MKRSRKSKVSILTYLLSCFICLQIITTLSLEMAQAVEPVWTHTGPSQGKALTLAVDPSDPMRVYAATRSGIFRTLDGGGYWKKILDGAAFGLVIDQKQNMTLYAIVDKALFKSSDGGDNWSRMGLACRGVCVFRTITIDPVDSSILYAGFSDGLKKSYDGGLNWESVVDETNGTWAVWTLAIDPSNPQTLYAGVPAHFWFGGGVYKSENGGQTWERKVNGLENTYITDLLIDPNNSNVVYAVIRKVWGPVEREGGLFKSEDQADSWVRIDQRMQSQFPPGLKADRFYIYEVAVCPSDSSLIYAGTSEGVFKSFDGGMNWSPANEGLPRVEVGELVVDPAQPDHIYTSLWGRGFQGVYKSTDQAKHWVSINAGFPRLLITSIAVTSKEGTVYVGTEHGVFVTRDGTNSWLPRNDGLHLSEVTALAVDPNDPSTAYVALQPALITGHVWSGGIFKTTDRGLNWRPINDDFNETTVNALIIDPEAPERMYAGTSWPSGMLKTEDGGVTWSEINNGITYPDIHKIVIDPNDSSTLYALTQWYYGSIVPGLFKSENGGDGWEVVPADFRIVELAIDPDDSDSLFGGTVNAGLARSTDGGLTWQSFPLPVPVGPCYDTLILYALAIRPGDSRSIFASGFYEYGTCGIYQSTDEGVSWEEIDSGLGWGSCPTAGVSGMCQEIFLDLTIDPHDSQRVLGATNNGVLIWDSPRFIEAFAQFGDGEGLVSEMILVNPSQSVPVEAAVSLQDDSGSPLSVDLNGEEVKGDLRASVPARGSYRLATDGQGQLLTGSVVVSSDSQLGGVILFGGDFGLAGVGSSRLLENGFLAPMQSNALESVIRGLPWRIYRRRTSQPGSSCTTGTAACWQPPM